MALKCSACGGDVKFNIQLGKAACEHCGAIFDDRQEYEQAAQSDRAYVYEDNYNNGGYENSQAQAQSAPVDNTVETITYQCSECGAEVRCYSEEMTIFCSYCGKQSFVKEKELSLKPKYIVPFAIDGPQIKEQYEKYLKGKLFVPKEVKDPGYIEKFNGIYIPYWSYMYQIPSTITGKGESSRTSGNYTITDHYDLEAEVSGLISDVAIDASKGFEDYLASRIAPFNTDQKIPFDTSYVAGLYADKESVSAQECVVVADKVVSEKIEKELKNELYGQGRISLRKSDLKEKFVDVKRGADLTLMPVWFLTHRNKDRVSYCVVNGQTGKMTMDLPVDKKAFMLFVCGLGVLLTIIFSILFSTALGAVSARSTCGLAIIMLGLVCGAFKNQIKDILRREDSSENLTKARVVIEENGIKETIKNASAIKNKVNESKIGSKVITSLLGYFIVFLIIMGNQSSSATASQDLVFFCLAMTILRLVNFFKIKKMSKKRALLTGYESKKDIASFALALAIMIFALVLYCINFASNIIYYGLTIAIACAMIVLVSRCVAGFDYLTSRKVPNFFERSRD